MEEATITFRDQPDEMDALLAPLEQAIGRLVVNWGTLHDDLAVLFAAVMGLYPNGMHIALAAWQSHSNDRAQREMLRAAAIARFNPANQRPSVDPFLKEIEWLLNQCDRAAEPRNNIVHASYTLSHTENGPETSSSDFFGNRRSKNLVGKDLVGEAVRCSDTSRALSVFCRRLTWSVGTGEAPPKRPI